VDRKATDQHAIVCDYRLHCISNERFQIVKRLLLILPLAGFLANGAERFVSPAGMDTNDGSRNAPWRTINYAATNTRIPVVAGDIVRVQPGTYNETVTENTDGTKLAPITYVADGPVILRRFDITGDYVRVIGFELTHVNDYKNEPLRVTGATGVELIDNYIHHTSRNSHSGGLTIGNATNLIVRGNRFFKTGILGTTSSATDAKAIGERWGYNSSDSVLIEYNTFSEVVEYINPAGQKFLIRNNVAGPSGPDWPTAHIDFVQPNGEIQHSYLDANWHAENPMNDSHFYLDEGAGTHHVTITRNVSIRSGDALVLQWRIANNHYGAHNIWAETAVGPSRTLSSQHAFLIWDSLNNWDLNDVFYRTTTDSQPYGHNGSWQITSEGIVMGNPGWVSYPERNLLLASNSAAIDSGVKLTSTAGSGTNERTIALEDAHWFHDGLNMTAGDKVYVGNDNFLTVTDVNWVAKTITIDREISWSRGEPVGFAYLGSGPDKNAIEFGSELLNAATMTRSGDTYSVTPNGDTRFVVFYLNGIPERISYNPPFVATLVGGLVSAKAYSLHPQPNPVIAVTLSDGERPSPPRNLRVVQ
jgi:hypothetical protein